MIVQIHVTITIEVWESGLSEERDIVAIPCGVGDEKIFPKNPNQRALGKTGKSSNPITVDRND